jgi:hypothetical protein
MKYRILTDEELSHLADDFKQFLIVTGVHAEEWEEMNRTDIPKAIQLVEIFSDTVLQKVYEKIGYLEFRSTDSCMVFNFGPESVKLISMQRKPDSECDLSTPETIHAALSNAINELTFFRSEKPYGTSREEEIHKMLEQGCFISSAEFWNLLEHVLN